MLNKIENEKIENVLWKDAKNIAKLIINKDIKTAYVKYESLHTIAKIFNKENTLNNTIKEYLQRKYKKENIDLFFMSFQCSYTNYNENEYGIAKYETLEKI